MKKKFLTTAGLSIFAFFLVSAVGAFGQAPLLVEDFDYMSGQLLTANGWTAHSGGGTNALAVVTPGLTYANYPSSGVANAVGMVTTGEDAHRTFAVQSTGAVYAAFMVNVTDASTDVVGGYFAHLGPDPIGTTFRGRVFIKKDASNNVAFGLSKAGTSEATVAYTGFNYALNTTYLIVLKYTIVDGTSNDTVSLYINPTLPGDEPAAATLTAIDNTTQSDISPGSFALRQGTASTHPTLTADGIRIGTTWASVTTAVTAPTQNVVDYNGDGKTDFAVVRNIGGGANGQLRWFVQYNGTGTFLGYDWGIFSDTVVGGDYDGDSKTDIAVFRPLSNNQPSGNAFFYILESSTNTLRQEDFGIFGDDATVVGDYDGDGKTDVAVFRSPVAVGAPATWYFRGSLNNPSGNISQVQWGVTGDFPAPGDYDGDGINDYVVQRGGAAQATFWLLKSTGGFETIGFGTPTDVIAPGDYDGDGKTDIAVIRQVSGQFNWFVLPSTTGMPSASPTAVFGSAASDAPAQGDYDGDGRTDIAIWRSSSTPGLSGFWYQGTTSGTNVFSFGTEGDFPVANYNVH